MEKQPGKFVGDTKCEKLPVEICGAGCVTEEQPEECHDKEVKTHATNYIFFYLVVNLQKLMKLQTRIYIVL